MPAKKNYAGYSSTEDRGIHGRLRESTDCYSVWKPRSAIDRLFADIENKIRHFWNVFIGTNRRESIKRRVEAFAGFRNMKKDSKGVLR